MKASVSQQQLAHGLNLVSRAVSPRSTLPVLANILVASDEGRLRLSATNLELGISCWIGAQIAEEGAITVPSRTFSDLVSALPNDTVQLNLNSRTQTLNVRCGTSVTDIKGIDAQEYPPIPVPDLQEGIELNVSDLKEMIQQVVFAASSDEARPVLQGVYMTVNGDEITLAATDGFPDFCSKGNPGRTMLAAHESNHPGAGINRTGAHRYGWRPDGHHGAATGSGTGIVPPEGCGTGFPTDRRKFSGLPGNLTTQF
jgi:hypothetical protein